MDPSREATRVLRKRRTYVNQELHPWQHLAMLLCPQSVLYRDLVAKDLISGSVLEIGFGTGAQVVQYAHKANWVTATEVDPRAVEWASKIWPLPRVEWLLSDICTAGTKPLFDTIMCIEVLEHTADPGVAMANISKLLTGPGTAWISVPKGETSNELHKHAWTPSVFQEDLLRYFPKVNMHTQWSSLALAECSNYA